MFRNFDVRGSADRTLIYLTLFASQCLVKMEKIEEKSTGALKDSIHSEQYSVFHFLNCLFHSAEGT
jgi:hypothetical protein